MIIPKDATPTRGEPDAFYWNDVSSMAWGGRLKFDFHTGYDGSSSRPSTRGAARSRARTVC